jgi:type I restriction enzyme R subunit
MTTRLAVSATYFLPFKRGMDGRAGNPPDRDGRNYKTAYLWEEVLQRDSLLDLLARFLRVDVQEKVTEDGKKVRKESLIFPRYRQLQAVRRMVPGRGTQLFTEYMGRPDLQELISKWLGSQVYGRLSSGKPIVNEHEQAG